MTRELSLFSMTFLVAIIIGHGQQNTTNLGDQSGTLGNNGTFVGFRAGRLNTDNNNSFFGSFAGDNNTTGSSNNFYGFNAGRDNTIGNGNTFIGVNAGRFNLEGNNNIAIGSNAGRENTTGNSNVSMGVNAGRNTNGGAGNISLGFNAARGNTAGNNNISIGSSTNLANTTGLSNIAMGSNAGSSNIEGNFNLYFGVNSGRSNLGNRNIFLGVGAGNLNAEGDGNVFIGYQAGFNELGSDLLYIDNSSTAIPLVYGDFSSNQLGINTNSIPNGMTFGVGGDALIEGTLYTNNRMSIGTLDDDPGFAFTVKGKIHVQEVLVDLEGAIAPDYVFLEDYPLRDLDDVETYIEQNGHLPNIPSAAVMEKEGVSLKEMNLKLLEKIEELTLYAIRQKKELNRQKELHENLEQRLLKLESTLRSN